MTLAGPGSATLLTVPRIKLSPVLFLFLCLTALLAIPAAAQPVDRIPATASQRMVTMKGTAHPAASRFADVGSVNPQLTITGLSLHALPSAAQQKELQALLDAQQDPTSPLFHKWLTPAEFGARYGLSDNDLAALKDWLATQGFSVISVSPSRTTIRFSGTVSQIESAFHTQLHRFQTGNEEHFANTTDIQLPASIAAVSPQIRGLNNFRPKPHVKRAKPAYTAGTNAGVVTYLTPGDWATIYNVSPIYNQTCGSNACDGTGMHVAVVGQTYVNTTDMTSFRTASGLSAPKINYVCIYPSVASPNSSTCTSSAAISTQGDLGEADLDIQWAGGIAKNATVDYVYAPFQEWCTNTNCTGNEVADPNTNYGAYDVFDALEDAVTSYTVNGSVVPVISMSYTSCESLINSAFVSWTNWLASEANAQGQTILVASGDDGAFGCDWYGDYPAKYGVYAPAPNNSPQITAVGGTTLSGDQGAQSTYWNVSNPSSPSSVVNIATALSYIPETAWNDSVANGQLSASGGGVSSYYALPSWQSSLAPSGVTGRMIPDVSFSASPDSNAYLYCSYDLVLEYGTQYGTECYSGFWTSKGYIPAIGGTSAGTPSFAGMLTLLVQKYGPQGNINPMLYSIANNSANYTSGLTGAVFHEIGASNTNQLCTYTAGGSSNTDPGCPSSGSFGYSVNTTFPYYNMATGLGSVDGYQLFQAMAATNTAVSSSLASFAQGSNITLTASVTPQYGAGTVTDGSVAFYAGSTALGSANVSSGVATLLVSATAANGFALGANTVSATYSGGSYLTSSGSTSVTATAALPLPTVVITPTSTSLMQGATDSFTVTVSGTGSTPSGNVILKAGSTGITTQALVNGSTTFTNIAATAANGFAVGNVTVTAAYAGDTNYSAANGTAAVTVYSPATSTTVATSPTSIALGDGASTVTFNVTVTGSTGTPSGSVAVKVGSVTVGTATLNGSGAAAVTAIAPTVANGFTLGSDTVTATYTPGSGVLYTTSNGTASLTVTAPAYTITPSSTSVSLSTGGSTTVTLNLASSTYADTTTLTATPSSSLITATLSSSSVAISKGGSGSATLTIAASASAANRAPRLPWMGFTVMGAVLAGVPLLRRRKRALAVLLTAAILTLLGLMAACGGGGGGSSTKTPRSYTVTVTGTGGISSTISVSVQ